jgi:hypothetical protein
MIMLDEETRALIDLYIKGLLDEPKRLDFERLMEENGHLQEETLLMSKIVQGIRFYGLMEENRLLESFSVRYKREYIYLKHLGIVVLRRRAYYVIGILLGLLFLWFFCSDLMA